jgi:lysophospholipid acyltransferase (LPLAT)-like uncharacterized protein
MSHALDFRTRIAIRLGHVAFRVLSATWRMRVQGWEQYVTRHERGERTVLVLWHGQMLMCIKAHARPIAVMISEHRDGEIIARVLKLVGHSAVRGSSSRGGARALLEGARVLAQGTDVAITPDGPRGPRHSFAPTADRAWRLRSWDGFEIPKPFARVTVVYSEPRTVSASSARAAAEQTDEFAAMMHDTQVLADGVAMRRLGAATS